MDPLMMEFLEQFEMALESRQKNGQLRMLNFACAEKVKKNSCHFLVAKSSSVTAPSFEPFVMIPFSRHASAP